MHPFSTPWKHEKTVRLSGFSRGWKKGALRSNGLSNCHKFRIICIADFGNVLSARMVSNRSNTNVVVSQFDQLVIILHTNKSNVHKQLRKVFCKKILFIETPTQVFHVKFAIFLRMPISKNICERLLLNVIFWFFLQECETSSVSATPVWGL